MKRLISLLLCIVFSASILASFTGCQKSNDPLRSKYNYDLSNYIDLPQYKGLPAEANSYSVDERDYIDKVVLSTRYYYARETEVSRAAQLGDIVYIDSSGTIDGMEFEGASASNKPLRIGSNTIGEAYENNLIGMSAGDTKSFYVSVPDTENELEELRGKTVYYTVKVNKVCATELPDYSDQFVKLYLHYDSIEEYEQSIIDSLKEQYKSSFYQAVIPNLWNTVVENTTVIKYPESEVKSEYDTYIKGITEYCEQYEITIGQFARANYQMNEDEFLAYAKEQAENRVKEDMICYSIARSENMIISDEIYEEKATNIAIDIYEMTLEDFEAKFSKDEIYRAIITEMVQEFIADNADVTYVEPEDAVNSSVN